MFVNVCPRATAVPKHKTMINCSSSASVVPDPPKTYLSLSTVCLISDASSQPLGSLRGSVEAVLWLTKPLVPLWCTQVNLLVPLWCTQDLLPCGLVDSVVPL